jgi:hypothetical protein
MGHKDQQGRVTTLAPPLLPSAPEGRGTHLSAWVEIVATCDPDGDVGDLADELAVRVAVAAMDMGVVVSIHAQIVADLPSDSATTYELAG